MHDSLINNAFFALLALGGGVAGVQAVARVVFSTAAVDASTTFATWAGALWLGA